MIQERVTFKVLVLDSSNFQSKKPDMDTPFVKRYLRLFIFHNNNMARLKMVQILLVGLLIAGVWFIL